MKISDNQIVKETWKILDVFGTFWMFLEGLNIRGLRVERIKERY